MHYISCLFRRKGGVARSGDDVKADECGVVWQAILDEVNVRNTGVRGVRGLCLAQPVASKDERMRRR